MPALHRRLFLPAAALSAAVVLSGCHHHQPPGVIFPPPPPVICPSLCAPAGAAADLISGSQAKAPPESDTPLADPEPIDLPTALRLANVQNPDIAVARERIREALAQQDRVEVLWLPDL